MVSDLQICRAQVSRLGIYVQTSTCTCIHVYAVNKPLIEEVYCAVHIHTEQNVPPWNDE